MNDLIENNSLNIVALQKVLNNIILNLGKTIFETADVRRSFKNLSSEKIVKERHSTYEDNLSRQTEESIQIDNFEEQDNIKPLKVVKNERLSKSSLATQVLNKKSTKNEEYLLDPSFGITVNSKGFGNLKDETNYSKNDEKKYSTSSRNDEKKYSSSSRNIKDKNNLNHLESPRDSPNNRSINKIYQKENLTRDPKIKIDPNFKENIKAEILSEIKQ